MSEIKTRAKDCSGFPPKVLERPLETLSMAAMCSDHRGAPGGTTVRSQARLDPGRQGMAPVSATGWLCNPVREPLNLSPLLCKMG